MKISPRLWVAPMVLTVSTLFACAPAPSEAPPTAMERVEPTVRGLLGLFERECVEQRNLAWAREEAERRRQYYCSDVLTQAAKAQDCAFEHDGEVSWIVPTTDGSSVRVGLAWWQPDWPPERDVGCSIEASEALGPILQTVAQEISEDPMFNQPPHRQLVGEDELWVWTSSDSPEATAEAPQLVLAHYGSIEDPTRRWALLRLTAGTMIR